VQEAATKTTDAGSSRLELAVERPAEEGGQPTPPFKIAGEVDYKAKRGNMTFDLSQFGLPCPPIPAVFERSVVYEKLPPTLLPGLTAEKPWVKIDAAAQAGASASGITPGQNGDPSQSLDFLRGASGDVKRIGSEPVRGVPTTHYAAVLDLQKAADASSAKSKATIESLIKTLGSSKQPTDVWLDNDGRLRRLRYSIDLSKTKVATSTPGTAGTVTFTLELYDFGTPVKVDIPPADQVTDLASLTGAGK